MLDKNFKYILFDLDGTLTESGNGIINSVKYALKHFHITDKSPEELRKFIGPPLRDSYMKICGLSKEQADEGLKIFREYFEKKGMFENEVYEGIEEVLRKLKDNGKILVVATSKPEKYSIEILEHFNLRKYFTVVVGSDFEETRVKKGDIIKFAVEKLKLEFEDFENSKCIMVGDREYDILGAKENGIKSIGVLYGYGTLVELTQARAFKVVKTPKELLEILL